MGRRPHWALPTEPKSKIELVVHENVEVDRDWVSEGVEEGVYVGRSPLPEPELGPNRQGNPDTDRKLHTRKPKLSKIMSIP